MKCLCAVILFASFHSLAFASCVGDDRTLTELLFRNQQGYNIITFKVLEKLPDIDGGCVSTVEILKKYFGTIDSSVIGIHSGTCGYYRECSGITFDTGFTYVGFISIWNGHYTCSENKWTYPLQRKARSVWFNLDEDKVKNELAIIETFKDIFEHKKTGHFVFKNSKKITVAEGDYKEGAPVGVWKHYYDTGAIKAEYNMEDNSQKQFDGNGQLISKKP